MPIPAARKASRRRSPPRKNTMLRRLYDCAGEELTQALACSGDERADRLLEMMMDPAYSRFSFPKLCERAGLRTTDVLGLVRRFRLDMALFVGFQRLPQVVEAVAQKALPGMVPCPRCAATAKDGDGQCRECGGKGEVYRRGDIKAQRLILEMFGLVR